MTAATAGRLLFETLPATLRLVLELELYVQPYHAGVQDSRRHAPRPSCHIGFDAGSQRVAFRQDGIRVGDVEELSFAHCRELFVVEDLANPQVQLIQPRREPGTRWNQRNRLCALSQAGVNQAARVRTVAVGRIPRV